MLKSATLCVLLLYLLLFLPVQVLAAPTAGPVTPNSGSGLTQSFTFQCSDPRGWQNINVADMLINSASDEFPNGSGSCYTMYYPATNTLYLVNDSYDGWLGPMALSTAATMNRVPLESTFGNSRFRRRLMESPHMAAKSSHILDHQTCTVRNAVKGCYCETQG